MVSGDRVTCRIDHAGPEHPLPDPISGSTPVKQLGDLFPRGVGVARAILGLSAYGYGTIAALLVLFLGRGGIGGQSVGLVVFSVAFLLTRAVRSPLVDRYGGASVARGTLLIEASGLALLATAASEGVALVAVAVTGVGLGVIYPATSKITLMRVAAPVAGAAMGAMTSFWDLGILAAGPLGGLITANTSYHTAFWVASAALATFTLTAAPATTLHPSTHRLGRQRTCRSGSAAPEPNEETPERRDRPPKQSNPVRPVEDPGR